ILLLICIGPVGYFLNNTSDYDYDKKDNLKFFIGAAAAAAVIAVLFFLIFLTGLHKKIDAFNWAKTVTGIFVILAIVLLVASSLVADTVSYYKSSDIDDGKIDFCQFFENHDKKYRCGQLTTGAVFGFLAM
ncbi:---NA---, partial [Paramuricea clavata]